MFRTGNPALKTQVFEKVEQTSGSTMSINGTVNKSLLLVLFVFTGASLTWANPNLSGGLLILSLIVAIVSSIVTIFQKHLSPYSAPVYAISEGVLLGAISTLFEARYPGIVVQAVILTFGVATSLLLAFKSRLIKPTENFKLGVTAATFGIGIGYFFSFIFSFFGVNLGFGISGGIYSIGISLFIVIVAALNLVLDFDFIEEASERGLPKYMEWYAAFGLMVTLIWLYLEILRLLAKTQSRK